MAVAPIGAMITPMIALRVGMPAAAKGAEGDHQDAERDDQADQLGTSETAGRQPG